MKTELKSPEKEKAKCIRAFRAYPDAKLAWCCHHQLLVEPLTEPWLNRVKYISEEKSKAEQASRFRSFRPVRVTLPDQVNKAETEYNKAWTKYNKARDEYVKAWNEYVKAWVNLDEVSAIFKSELEALHNQDWPDHTWNGNKVEGTSSY